MKPSTPPWLLRSFVEAVQSIHASASEELAQQVGEELIDRWNAPTRTFHNAHHLANMLSRIDELSATTHDPETLRIAAWFWGALGTQAAEFSAEQSDKKISHCHRYVAETLGELGFDDDTKKRVCELIAHLFEHHAPSGDLDATALVDASLAVFASMPQEYKRYRQAVREEYPHLTDLQYQVRRRRYIRSLLKRSTIFRSPFTSQWEASARQNLEAELVNLDASIAKLDPSIGDDSAFDRPDPHANEPVSRRFVVKRSEHQRRNKPVESPVADDRFTPAPSSADGGNTTPDKFPADRADSAPSAPSAPAQHVQENDSSDDGGSSLEAEPDFLEPVKAAPPRRLSAKEYARETGIQRKNEQSASHRQEDQNSENARADHANQTPRE